MTTNVVPEKWNKRSENKKLKLKSSLKKTKIAKTRWKIIFKFQNKSKNI